MEKLRIAVIGSGMAFAPHAQSLLDLKESIEVVQVMSRSPEKRTQVQQQYGFPVTDSLDAIWNDASIQAVMILTPPATHLELVEAAARAGKHILLEKPLDVSLERACKLVVACERHNVKIGTVFQHRFRAGSRKLDALIKAGELGRLVSVSVNIPWWRPQEYYDQPGRGTYARDGGGVLITQAIHTMDLTLSLVGQIDEVYALAATTFLHKMESEDIASATLRFADGAIGTIYATTAAFPGFDERIDIIGEHATARLEGGVLRVLFHDGREVNEGKAEGGTGASPMDFSHATHRDLIASFAQAIRDGKEPVANGRDALKVHFLIDAMLSSARNNRPVKVSTRC